MGLYRSRWGAVLCVAPWLVRSWGKEYSGSGCKRSPVLAAGNQSGISTDVGTDASRSPGVADPSRHLPFYE